MDKIKERALIEAATNKPAKTERGRGGTRNFPNARFDPKTDEDRALVGKLLGEVLVEYRKERVKSDDELMQRLDDYFTHCAMTGQVPTVEEMCMCTGYSHNTCNDWITGRNQGFSPSTSVIMKKAKEVLKTFDAKLVIAGKLNFLAYCFRAKNYYGMVDKQEMVLTPNTNNDSDIDPEAIKARYMIAGGESDE